MSLSKQNISLIILLIFYAVGVATIGFELKPDVVKLSWFNLLLTGTVVFVNAHEKGIRFYLYCLIVFLSGFLVEVLGVASSWPFGSYYYGESLGWKLYDVPLILGLNWWVLIYASIHLSMLITSNKWLRILIAPALMLGIDFLIEPLCSKLDFWHWKDGVIPADNFWSWYVISLVLCGIYFLGFRNNKTNLVAVGAFLIQGVFFTLLNLLL